MSVLQLAPQNMPPQQEPHHDSPQYVPQEEEPFEVELMVYEGQESQCTSAEEHQLPQNDENNNNGKNVDNSNNDNNDDHDDENDNDNDDEEDDQEYTPLSNSENEKMYHDADELKSFRNEALIPTRRLRGLLGHIGISTAPEFRIKRVPHPKREEFRAVVEVFNGPNVISRHMDPAFRASCSDIVADAAWQAITAWNRTHHHKLKNSIYHLLPQRKKDKFKASGVRTDIPRMEMVHHQDASVEMSIHLLVAHWAIQSLHNQLRNSDAIIKGYQRMVAGEANNLYASNTYTRSATSIAQGSDEEPPVNSHSPSGSRTC
jgi:hypothetical protein